MRAPRTIVLDNEAVQALVDVRHRKHRLALAAIETLTPQPPAVRPRLVVPTAVRVEAGWDRRAPGAAVANRLKVEDDVLDADAANRASALRDALGLSVADGHLGAALASRGYPKPMAVVTSDVDDARKIIDHLGLQVVVVPI